MVNIHSFAIVSLLLCCVSFWGAKNTRQKKIPAFYIFLLLGAGLLIRSFIAANVFGFESDIHCFSAWAERMYQVGPSEFYSTEVFTDYPPLYMLALYILGFLRNVLNLAYFSKFHLLLIKLPAILCDLACSYLIYREAEKQHHRTPALFLMSAYLFLPAVILNSSSWGQIDSTHTLLIVLMCLHLMKGKMIPAYVVYGIGVLLKPQTLIFTPVLIVGILDHVFLNGFRKERFFRNLTGGLAVILGMVVVCLPFGLNNVLRQYTGTLASYPYASANAYNFWSLMGMNFMDQNTRFLFLSSKTWGILVILLLLAAVYLVHLRLKNAPSKYFILSALIILTMFVLSVRMHERYLYPVLSLLIFAYIYYPAKSIWFSFTALSFLHYYNAAHVLYFYDPARFNREDPFALLISTGMLLIFVFFLRVVHQIDAAKALPELTAGTARGKRFRAKRGTFKKRFLGPLAPIPSAKRVAFTKKDLALLLAITALYSYFALHNLGDRQAPVTTYELKQNDSITLEFSENRIPQTLTYYLAPEHDRHITVKTRHAKEEAWSHGGEIVLNHVFTWTRTALPAGAKYMRLTFEDAHTSLIELSFADAAGEPTVPLNAAAYAALFDEAALQPKATSFRNSMYFDEVFHARGAYEYLHGLPAYEYTHPPLGKILISLGISIFGMNPFGWRIIGTLFGILMLPLIYFWGKRLTGNTPATALGCFLFAFDFMHFVQTRIATIDVFVTFFIIAMYTFMYQYCTTSFYDTDLKKTFIPLGACGIAMGFAVASKWTGIYAGLGLAVLFFAHLLRRYREYLYAKASPGGHTGELAHKEIVRRFLPYTKKTIGFCLIFFVAIPACIYLLSYIPFVDGSNTGLLNKMLTNQTNMLNYHSTLQATHPYASIWNQWPTMIRPVWYYSRMVSDTLREGISAFGNPLVWWTGIPAFLYLLHLLRKHLRSSIPANEARPEIYTTVFLLVGYLSGYLPWFGVTRVTFIYHYFPSVPFVVMMIIHSLMHWRKRVSNKTFVIGVSCFAILAFGLFLLFYPVLAGEAVDVGYVQKYLRWLPSWILVDN